ncbi:hypothetical protein K0M31_004925, partial [Melipona bicolor]
EYRVKRRFRCACVQRKLFRTKKREKPGPSKAKARYENSEEEQTGKGDTVSESEFCLRLYPKKQVCEQCYR